MVKWVWHDDDDWEFFSNYEQNVFRNWAVVVDVKMGSVRFTMVGEHWRQTNKKANKWNYDHKSVKTTQEWCGSDENKLSTIYGWHELNLKSLVFIIACMSWHIQRNIENTISLYLTHLYLGDDDILYVYKFFMVHLESDHTHLSNDLINIAPVDKPLNTTR